MTDLKPYYADDWATIYCGDCRTILPSLGRFDLCLTDPPYGIKRDGGMGGGDEGGMSKKYKGKCGFTGKQIFRSEAHASIRAAELRKETGIKFRCYQCEYCGSWHLTKSNYGNQNRTRNPIHQPTAGTGH
jgi:hypothetical protein